MLKKKFNTMRHKPCHASNVEMTVSVTHLLKDTSRFDAKNTADQNGNQVITPFIHHGDIHGSWSLPFCHYLCTYICTNFRCIFPSNQIVHKISFNLCIWASDPLIRRF